MPPCLALSAALRPWLLLVPVMVSAGCSSPVELDQVHGNGGDAVVLAHEATVFVIDSDGHPTPIAFLPSGSAIEVTESFVDSAPLLPDSANDRADLAGKRKDLWPWLHRVTVPGDGQQPEQSGYVIAEHLCLINDQPEDGPALCHMGELSTARVGALDVHDGDVTLPAGSEVSLLECKQDGSSCNVLAQDDLLVEVDPDQLVVHRQDTQMCPPGLFTVAYTKDAYGSTSVQLADGSSRTIGQSSAVHPVGYPTADFDIKVELPAQDGINIATYGMLDHFDLVLDERCLPFGTARARALGASQQLVGINFIVGNHDAETALAASNAPRRRNIALGLRRLDGQVLASGHQSSFLEDSLCRYQGTEGLGVPCARGISADDSKCQPDLVCRPEYWVSTHTYGDLTCAPYYVAASKSGLVTTSGGLDFVAVTLHDALALIDATSAPRPEDALRVQPNWLKTGQCDPSSTDYQIENLGSRPVAIVASSRLVNPHTGQYDYLQAYDIELSVELWAVPEQP